MGLQSVSPVQQLGFQGKKREGAKRLRDGKAGRRRKKEKTSKRDRERANSLLTEELQRDFPGGPGG